MKNTLNLRFNKLFFGALCLLIIITIAGTVGEYRNLAQFIRPLYIPVFLIFFFINNKTIKAPLILCLLYFFLGDVSSMFINDYIFVKTSSIMYFLSYMCLISFIAPKFKLEGFNKFIASYLVAVVLINIYFLVTICGILKTIMPDSLEVFLFGIKSISLIVLLFISFGVYLNSEKRVSILFLLMALSFIFSDFLNYVSQYYVYHWSFSMLDKVFHIIGLYCLFTYIYGYNKLVAHKKQVHREEHISTNNVLA